MSIKLIGLDLDGTVLTSDKKITDRTKSVLMKAISQGIVIVPVTGRPLSGLPEDFLSIPGIRYAITANGATTYDLQNQVILRKHHIARKIASQILNVTLDRDIIREIFIKGYGYEDHHSYDLLLKHLGDKPIISYVKATRKPIDDLDDFLSSQTANVEGISIMCHDTEERDLIYDRLKEFHDIRIVLPAPGDLEINHLHADKGQALLELGVHLGIPKRSIMAIGDSDNDYGLLSSVGFPVAMENANEALKKISSFITRDNQHDGVASAIESFAL